MTRQTLFILWSLCIICQIILYHNIIHKRYRISKYIYIYRKIYNSRKFPSLIYHLTPLYVDTDRITYYNYSKFESFHRLVVNSLFIYRNKIGHFQMSVNSLV